MSADPSTVEARGELICRQVLGGDEPEIVDLRAQRGVSVDARDDLRPFYSLKPFESAEPAEVNLSDSDVNRSLDADFFIVVASGLAAAEGDWTVRIIADPQASILVSEDGSAYLNVATASGFCVRPTV